MRRLSHFLRLYTVAEICVAGACYLLAAGILLADVIARELFHDSLWGAARMAILLANTAALIGISVAFALNQHIRPVVLDHLVPPALVAPVCRAGNALSAILLFAGAAFAAELVRINHEMGFTATPLDLKIWLPQTVLVYALVASGLRCLAAAIIGIGDSDEGRSKDSSTPAAQK